MGQLFSSTEMRSRLGRWVASLIGLALLAEPGLLSISGALAAVPAGASTQEVCESVSDLTEQALFEEALALIVSTQKTSDPSSGLVCEPERLNALYDQAVFGSDIGTPRATFEQTTVRHLCELTNELTRNDQPEKALKLVKNLREPSTASPDVPAAAGLVVACERARVNATAWRSEVPPPNRTWAQSFNQNWSGALQTVFNPLQEPGMALLGCLAALFVIARLMIFVPGPPMNFTSRAERGAVGVLGLGLVGFSTLTFISLGGHEGATWQTGALLLPAIGCLGSWLLSRFAASRLALKISTDVQKEEAEDEIKNQIQPAEVIAHLSELGAAKPEGLEVASSTDVTALNAIVSPAMPVNAAIKVLVSIFEEVAGLTPWRVRIKQVTVSQAAVEITRNHRAVDSAIIDADALELPSTEHKSQIPKLVAAYILMTMAPRHPGFEALCGATKWESVGRQYVALTELRGDENRTPREKLLRRAVEDDYLNLPAQVALNHSLYRDAEAEADLTLYLKWLQGRSEKIQQQHRGQRLDGDGYLDIHRRILITFFAALNNLIAVTRGAEHTASPADWACEEHAERLVTLLEDSHSPELRDMMRLQTKSLLEELPRNGTTLSVLRSWTLDEELARESPSLAYNIVCSQVRKFDRLGFNASTRILLKCALEDDALRQWAPKDPELKRLHQNDEFKKLVGRWPRGDYWEIDPFKSRKTAFETAGVSHPSLIAAHFDSATLSNYLDVPLPVAEFLLHTSTLVRAAVATTLSTGQDFRVELVDQLISQGIVVPAQLAEPLIGPSGTSLAASLSGGINERTWSEISPVVITNWLRRLRLFAR
jgi:hypothetical protein